jgi:glycosyltransferase involved in cell wall biosynthesis
MHVAVVIPTYRSKSKILGVLQSIGNEVHSIYVIDDACPEQSGDYVLSEVQDPRIKVLRNAVNLGVGGATLHGFKAAIHDGANILIKIDSDGQMDCRYIPKFIQLLERSNVDFVKGNRFYFLRGLRSMPWIRLLGNAALSFMTKLSTGYWSIMDPTNGFIGIKAKRLKLLDMDKIDPRYFFETDLLFHLSMSKTPIIELYMPPLYGDEKSNLSIIRSLFEFGIKHMERCFRRIFYQYFIREVNPGSLALIAAILFNLSGFVFGMLQWHKSYITGVPVSTGTVMFAALPIILGVQFFIYFLQYDAESLARAHQGVIVDTEV